MSKQPAKKPATKEDTLKPGEYLEADNVIIRYMGPKDKHGKYAVRVEDKLGRKKPTGIKRLSSEGMRRDDALDRAKELLAKQPSQPFKLGRFTVTPVKPAAKKTQKKGGRKTRRKKRHRRRRTRKRKQTKRRVKRRRKTTRKKRGRGIGPSSLAKGATAALAASAVMGQGSAAISPQGRDVQRQLNAASCSKIQNEGRHMVADLHPDRGGNPEDFSEAFKRLQKRRNACGQGRQRGDTNSKPKPQRRPGESAKKARQRARRAKQARMQEEQAKARERARTQRQQEADARAGRRQQQQQENTESTGTSYMRDIGVGAAAVGAAGLVAREMGRGRPRVRNTRIVTRNDGSRVLVRNDGSVIRELTPERR